ncbi:hypothetical protein, partial [Tenacibaculum gallaicum]|uniref:hypothetical protein n=1 Tax=Tenacibaculum gallaicum TaxID=561505 RepID=UPI001472E36A
APFSYELFDNGGASVGTTTTEFINTAAGTYTVVATDRLGCDSAPVTVVINPSQTVDFDVTTTCFDGTSGSILVTNTVGNGDYQYNINGNPWQNPDAATPNQYTFTGLTPNTYTVNVKDGRGCITTKSITINPQLQATATPTNASCTPGSIAISATGGTGIGTYEYAVVTAGDPVPTTGFSNTNPITNLGPNTYDVYVRDAASCTTVVNNITIANVPPVTIASTANQPSCNGDLGSIDVSISNGQAPYSFTVVNTAGTTVDTVTDYLGASISFNNLSGNETYTIEITDDLGCKNANTVTLNEVPPILMNLESVLPADCTTIDPSNTGFNFNFKNYTLADYAPYDLEYTIDGTNWFPITNAMHSVSVAPHPTPGDNLYQVLGLTPGQTYYPSIRILNTDGTTRCREDNGIFIMPFQVSGIVVNVTVMGDCNLGYSVEVEAQDGSGVSGFEFGISTEDPINTGTWHPEDDPTKPRIKVFDNIIPGLNYQFFVRDIATGCIEMNDEPITYPDSTFDVSITPTALNQSCNGANNGELSFLIDDTDGVLNTKTVTWELYNGVDDQPLGITGTISNTVSYSYTLNSSGTPVAALQNLPPGLYFIVLDAFDGGATACQWASGDIEIKEGQPITGNLNKLNDITCNVPGKIRVENVLGGFAPYTYNVTLSEATATATVTGNEITVTAPTSITSVDVTVEVEDSNGTGACTANLGTVTLNVAQLPTTTAVADSCPANKTITATVTTGVAPYQYSLNGGATFSTETTNTTFTQNNVTPGSYDIVVRDATGCKSVPTTVIVHENVTFDVVPTKNAECVLNGEATLTINSGSHNTATFTANYTYSVDGGAPVAIPAGNTTAIISLAPGTYTVSVTDINTGCTTGTQTVTIQDAEIPSFTASAEASLCSGDNSGSITLTAVD